MVNKGSTEINLDDKSQPCAEDKGSKNRKISLINNNIESKIADVFDDN